MVDEPLKTRAVASRPAGLYPPIEDLAQFIDTLSQRYNCKITIERSMGMADRLRIDNVGEGVLTELQEEGFDTPELLSVQVSDGTRVMVVSSDSFGNGTVTGNSLYGAIAGVHAPCPIVGAMYCLRHFLAPWVDDAMVVGHESSAGIEPCLRVALNGVMCLIETSVLSTCKPRTGSWDTSGRKLWVTSTSTRCYDRDYWVFRPCYDCDGKGTRLYYPLRTVEDVAMVFDAPQHLHVLLCLSTLLPVWRSLVRKLPLAALSRGIFDSVFGTHAMTRRLYVNMAMRPIPLSQIASRNDNSFSSSSLDLVALADIMRALLNTHVDLRAHPSILWMLEHTQ